MFSNPRFFRSARLTRPLFPAEARRAGRYVRALYRLAKKAEAAPAPGGDAPWLDVVVIADETATRRLDDLKESFAHQQDDEATLTIRTLSGDESASRTDAANEAVRNSKAVWLTFLSGDDLLAPGALKMLRNALGARPDTALIYTDELLASESALSSKRLVPRELRLKPAFDPILLSGLDYIGRLALFRRDRLLDIGPIRAESGDAAEYDLLLRYVDGLAEDRVIHLPYPAVWRRTDGVIRTDPLTASHERDAPAPRYGAPHPTRLDEGAASWPKISIIIPSRNGFPLISRILSDLYERTDYPDFEVLVVDNGSDDQQVLALYDRYAQERRTFRAFVEQAPFNFSRAVNKGMDAATGDHFLFLNNDIEVIDPGWLKEMVSCLAYPGAGVVGARLLYPNDTIQHAGVVVRIEGAPGHRYHKRPADFPGPMNRLLARGSLTCVTGAALLLSGDCARTVGRWDEDRFAVAYNDVDYCLRAYNAGFRVVWTPFACLYHHEGVSRGSDKLRQNRPRFERERDALRAKHQTVGFLDPASHPGFKAGMNTPVPGVPKALFAPRLWLPRQETT